MNFLKLLKPFSLAQHFQVHGYNTRNKNDLHATYYHKSHMDVEKFLIEQGSTGIHCHQVSKMKNPLPSLKLL